MVVRMNAIAAGAVAKEVTADAEGGVGAWHKTRIRCRTPRKDIRRCTCVHLDRHCTMLRTAPVLLEVVEMGRQAVAAVAAVVVCIGRTARTLHSHT